MMERIAKFYKVSKAQFVSSYVSEFGCDEDKASQIYENIKFIESIQNYYENKIKQEKVLDFEVPYTTMNIGMIKGGESVNSVAGKCEISIDFRIKKKEHLESITEKIKDLLKQYNSK